MASALLVDYLRRARACFVLQAHEPACTAAAIARCSQVAPWRFAKVVMVKVDAELAMVVLPASRRLPLQSLRRAIGAHYVMLARERDFRRRFPRCEAGAIPPFGHLFGLRSWLLPGFDEGSAVAFSAGSHSEIIQMPFTEFRRLAHAQELGFDDPMPGCLPLPLAGPVLHAWRISN